MEYRINITTNTLRGFSTLELMIALMIMTTTLVAVTLAALGIPSALADGHEREVGASEASVLLQKELLFGLHSFSSVVSVATTTSEISNTSYQTSLAVTLLPDGLTKKLTSTTSWINARGIAQSVTFSGLVTDFADAIQKSCNTVLAGDWTHPSITTLHIQPPSPIESLALSTSTLVAAVSSAKSRTDPTLFFFTISSSTHPVYLGSIDNATSTRSGYAAIATHGTLVFGANTYGSDFSTCVATSTCSQLQIINMADPGHASVVENFQLPTTTPPYATGAGGQSAGKSILYANGLIYLGLQKTDNPLGEEFNIINVQNPESPIWLGGYSIGRTVNHIELANGYAYLATDNPSAELTILDVHDPTNIKLVGSYNEPGNTTFGFGEALALASSTLLLGRSYILGEPQFTLFDISSSSIPRPIGSEPITSTTTSASIEDVIMRSYIAFVLATSSLELWDLTDPTTPIPYAPPIPLPGVGGQVSNSSLACQDNTLYLASTDSTYAGYLTVITGS